MFVLAHCPSAGCLRSPTTFLSTVRNYYNKVRVEQEVWPQWGTLRKCCVYNAFWKSVPGPLVTSGKFPLHPAFPCTAQRGRQTCLWNCSSCRLINVLRVLSDFECGRQPLFCCCSVAKLCLTPSNPMDHSMPGSSELHHVPESAQIHVHWVSDTVI